MEFEKALIKNFVTKSRQERYLNLLDTKKGREKLRKYLPHFSDLENSAFEKVNPRLTKNEIYHILLQKNAPQECYIIAEISDYDGITMFLQDAINSLSESGISFLLCCIPDKLVYYEGEDKNEKLIGCKY